MTAALLPASMIEPWGKLQRDDSSQRLSLVGHCIDVAAVFSALLALPTMRRRVEALAGRVLTDQDVERLTVLCFLHDVGKASAGFYAKSLPKPDVQAWQRAFGVPDSQLGHTHVVAPLCAGGDFEPHQQALRLWEWCGWWPNAIELWLAAVSHRGQPITLQAMTSTAAGRWPTWTAPVAGYEPLQGLRRLGEAITRLWPRAFEGGPGLAWPSGLVHAFAGLVSLADWIGSNTDHFDYGFAAQDESRWAPARGRAARALCEIGLDLAAARADLATRRPGFQVLFDNPPRPMQEAAATRLDERLVILEAETGSGKTEAALWRFTKLFEAGEVDALSFLLPTRVAAGGIYERLQGFVERVFPNPATRPAWVLAVPGDLRANGVQGERQPGLPFAGVLWPDSVSPESRFWSAEHSKRYFAAGLLAGTVDQFLLSALQTGHAHLRGALSLRSLVVVDEVHASDPYMTRLLRAALARHAAAGGHALLLSATLTGAARSTLLAAGQPVRRRGGFHRLPAPPEAWARRDAPYPCLAHAQGLDAADPAAVASAPNKRVRCVLLAALGDPAQVARRARAALERGQRVLILRNTVGLALATQRALEAELGPDHPALFRVAGHVVLHHGRYAREDRRRLDAAVAERFGKGAVASREPVVLAGTQTLEISIDCDADLLITDLAPVDVLLQRLGRLHRHAERHPLRPGGHDVAEAVVLVPDRRALDPMLRPGGARGVGWGARSAYPNLLAIEACWREIEAGREWLIPQDNRRLVEAGCDGEVLRQLADSLGAPWPAHWLDLQGKASGQRTAADVVTLDWLRPWAEAAPGELQAEARTRLGLDAFRVVLPEPWVTPLGQVLTALDLPAWMWPVEPASLSVERMPFGGSTRSRVSSQALKRRWRFAGQESHERARAVPFSLQSLGLPMGERTKEVIERAVLPQARAGLVPLHVTAEAALRDALITALYGDKAADAKSRQALFFGEPEIDYLRDVCRSLLEQGATLPALCGEQDPDKSALKAWGDVLKAQLAPLRKNLTELGKANLGTAGLESALWGRMVTSDPDANRDAAVHVAHAFTVHAIERELDYVTAVDDLRRRDGGVGSAGIFDIELTSGLYYLYLCVDVELLVANLGGDAVQAAAVLGRLTQLVARVSPGAKKGSTAPYAHAEFLLIETGDDQPRTLANAYRDALDLRGGELFGRAVRALQSHLGQFDAAYGAATQRAQLSVTPPALEGVPVLGMDALAVWLAAQIQG
ncbi:MAG: type I-E CRISPR-associated protein Cas7/Cse4/CasC [Roseateles sp.]|uniref:type I-E CRISPR-associated protein Cas7/Cse4/CasC n=1 Tax=Roseateles sp. TaxID=1971397 RepID=UPI0039EC6F36